jgi:hypothetical protein
VKVNPYSASAPSNPIQYFFKVPGILLEYIDGFMLSNIGENAPRVSWQRICDEAIRVVNIVCDHNVLNKDVRLENMMVRQKKGSKKGYEVFMIDFALSRLRGGDETNDEWRRAKWSQDEEGAIGYVMQSRLGGGFRYKPSDRYIVYENV